MNTFFVTANIQIAPQLLTGMLTLAQHHGKSAAHALRLWGGDRVTFSRQAVKEKVQGAGWRRS